MPNHMLEGLPVEGDIIARYVIVQQPLSGCMWIIRAQRQVFDYAVAACWPLDLTRPTRLVQVLKDGSLSVVRSWN